VPAWGIVNGNDRLVAGILPQTLQVQRERGHPTMHNADMLRCTTPIAIRHTHTHSLTHTHTHTRVDQ